jgi:hypothetical protein
MAYSPVATISFDVPETNPLKTFTMNPFWNPTSPGNGRLWVSGYQGPTPFETVEIYYFINGVEYFGTVTEVDKPWGFFITGDSPSPWGTVDVTEVFEESDYYYTYQVEELPSIVKLNGEVIPKVLTVSDFTDSPAWAYDSVSQILYFKNFEGFPIDTVQAIIDPVFLQGENYSIRIEARTSLETVELIDETIMWPYQVRDYVTRYLKYLLPTYAKDSPAMRKIYTVLAKQAADRLIWFDDVVSQFFIDFTTWSIDMWEDQVGALTVPSVHLDQRKALVKSRRLISSSRKEFYDALLAVSPNISVSHDYDSYRVDIKLSGAPNPALRRALEKVIQEKKPVGIRVVVSYSQFIAGISLAGDSL